MILKNETRQEFSSYQLRCFKCLSHENFWDGKLFWAEILSLQAFCSLRRNRAEEFADVLDFECIACLIFLFCLALPVTKTISLRSHCSKFDMKHSRYFLSSLAVIGRVEIFFSQLVLGNKLEAKMWWSFFFGNLWVSLETVSDTQTRVNFGFVAAADLMVYLRTPKGIKWSVKGNKKITMTANLITCEVSGDDDDEEKIKLIVVYFTVGFTTITKLLLVS